MHDINTAADFPVVNPADVMQAFIEGIRTALSDKDYCDGDPFGERRYRKLETFFAYVTQKGNITTLRTSIHPAARFLTEAARKRAKEDVVSAANLVAQTVSARVVVISKPANGCMICKTTGDAESFVPAFPFEVRFYHTKHYANENIPDAKVVWDSYCSPLPCVQPDSQPGRPLQPDDFMREFRLGRHTYRITGVDDSAPTQYASAIRLTGRATNATYRVRREEIETAIYEEEYEDKNALAAEKDKRAEREFYANLERISDKVERRCNPPVVYKEIFTYHDNGFMVVGINYRAKKYPVIAEKLDGDNAGERYKFPASILNIIVEQRNS